MMRYLILAVFPFRMFAAEINEDEALSLRRIADFWEEGEYQIAKNQMEYFLEEFPDSSYQSTLSSALGDLFLREKSYQTALNYYAQVQDPALLSRIFLHRMQCLYHLEWHATLADECEIYLQREKADPAERLQATYLLAIALYSQALTNHQNPQTLTTLAERAKPYFEYLATSELSEEVAGAFAHLQCILQDYQGASKIYLDLAEKTDHPEEYLFQAALIQTKYDQHLALQTFDRLAVQEGGAFAEEAAYNMLVLYFEQGLYEKIIADKEKFAQSVPPAKRGLCSLFIGQSYLHLKRYAEAASALNAFLDSDVPADRIRAALLFLVEAAYQSQDVNLLDQAIGRLDPNDVEMPKALFCRAILFKTKENYIQAKEQIGSLLSAFSTFPERPHVVLELAHLHSLTQEWASCRQVAASFLKEFLEHELTASAWHVLLAASSELADKKQFISDLEQLLQEGHFLSFAERSNWVFRLAKTEFELGNAEVAIQRLLPLFEGGSFSEQGNAELLLAFCFRDARNEEGQFQQWAEKGLASHASLISSAQQHVALFNSYIQQNQWESAANHLYAALLEHAVLQPANVFWLADYFYARYEKDPSFADVASVVLSHLPPASWQEREGFHLKLAKLHRNLGQAGEAISLLEELDGQYRAACNAPWIHTKETRVCLAELYLASGISDKAKSLFDEVASSGHYRDRFTATAALQSVRLNLAGEQALTCLKNLVLQKKLEHEPIHLEAALDYIDLASQKDPAKKLFLLKKIKSDFESEEDLLSKDYHAARVKFPEQSKIYLDYMQYFEAEIQLQEKPLHTKAKEILLQIRNEVKDPLLSRVEALLKT